MIGPAEIAAQCSPKTSIRRRSTVSPATETSLYSVRLPSGSRTTSRVASAMARIVPRNTSRQSAQVEDDGQPHAQVPRSDAGGKRHAIERAHRLQRRLVEQAMRRRPREDDVADRAGDGATATDGACAADVRGAGGAATTESRVTVGAGGAATTASGTGMAGAGGGVGTRSGAGDAGGTDTTASAGGAAGSFDSCD